MSSENTEMLRVARIGKPHGIRGEVTVQVFTDSPEQRFAIGETLTVEPALNSENTFEKLTVKSARWNKKILLLGFEEFSDRNTAEAHRNSHLCSAAEHFEGDDDAWYSEELEGLSVRRDDADGEEIGVVTELRTGDAQDLLEVKTPTGTSVLLPFVEKIIPEIDVEAGIIIATPPPGLLELNQES